MKVLLVVAHPLHRSLCHALADHAHGALSAAGHDVTIDDLYAADFAPCLTTQEREAYYQPGLRPSEQERTDQLLGVEALVLVFPTWWFGFPAILKGWFDRVFLPGIAYHHAENLGAIRPNLLQLRQVLVVTTLGAPWWVDWFVMFKPVKRILRHAIFGTCAPNAKMTYLALYRAENLSRSRFEGFVGRINRAIQSWRMG